MNPALKAWNASFTRRWHTHAILSDTDDRNSGHQQRCALLILVFWPDASRDLIVSAIVHDQGECDAGDVSRTAKRKHPTLRTLVRDVEQDSIRSQNLPVIETTPELEFVDLLDSVLWVLRHKPTALSNDGWPEQIEELRRRSRSLGIYDPVDDLMCNAERFYT